MLKKTILLVLFFYIFNLNSDVLNNEKQNEDQTRGKLSTTFILSAISNALHEVAKASSAQTDQEKMESVLNITATVLAVAAQAASKDDGESKSIVLKDIQDVIGINELDKEEKSIVENIIVALNKYLFSKI